MESAYWKQLQNDANLLNYQTQQQQQQQQQLHHQQQQQQQHQHQLHQQHQQPQLLQHPMSQFNVINSMKNGSGGGGGGGGIPLSMLNAFASNSQPSSASSTTTTAATADINLNTLGSLNNANLALLLNDTAALNELLSGLQQQQHQHQSRSSSSSSQQQNHHHHQQQQQQQQQQQYHHPSSSSISPNNGHSSMASPYMPTFHSSTSSSSSQPQQLQINQSIHMSNSKQPTPNNNNNNDPDQVAIHNLNQMLLASSSSSVVVDAAPSMLKKNASNPLFNNNYHINSLIEQQNGTGGNGNDILSQLQQQAAALNNGTGNYNNRDGGGDNNNDIGSGVQTAIKSSSSRLAKRELGNVEKMLASYGFVKCLTRERRLFFHHSSLQQQQQQMTTNGINGNGNGNNNNNIPDLKVGDLVEFEETLDKRNGKPIAINLVKYELPLINNNNNNNTNKYQQQQQQSPINLHLQSPNAAMDANALNMLTLKQLLLKQSSASSSSSSRQPSSSSASNDVVESAASVYNQQQQNYQYLMKGLNLLNLHQDMAPPNQLEQQQQQHMHRVNGSSGGETAMANSNFNSIMSLLNNPTNTGNTNGIAKMNHNSNSNSGASVEVIEGTIAIASLKSHMHGAPPLEGRITYQQNGETFYIPYTLADVLAGGSPASSRALKMGDRVRFCIGQHQHQQQQQQLSSSPGGGVVGLYAYRVELAPTAAQAPPPPPPTTTYRGIVTSIKDTFGKIEHEEQCKETFFLFNDYKPATALDQLRVGLNVEFEVQDRFGRCNAYNIRKLADGTVTFDELSTSVYVGRVTQSPIQPASTPTPTTSRVTNIGRLIFDANDEHGQLVELTFGERDRVLEAGEYTLLEGDFVQFRVASDKRLKQQQQQRRRAAQISLIEEHSLLANSANTKERRQQGVLVALFSANDVLNNMVGGRMSAQLVYASGAAAARRVAATATTTITSDEYKYGAIECLEQDEIVYFSMSEVIRYVRFAAELTSDASATAAASAYTVSNVELEVGDSLEFSLVECKPVFIFNEHIFIYRKIWLIL